MGCSCSGAISQASADIVTAVNAVEAAVDACCDEIIDYYNMTAENIGQGLEACCTAWSDAGVADVTIPGYNQDMTCPDGSTVTFTIPDRNISTGSWAGTYAYGISQQVEQANNAAQLYNNQYSAWLNAYQDWQQAQIVPQIIAMVAQIASITAMYDKWNDYLGYTNGIMQNLSETVFPELSNEFMGEISGDYTEHVAKLQERFDPTLELVDERLDWLCEKSDQLCDAYFDEGTGGVETGYATIEKQHASNMAQNMSNIAVAAQCAAQDLKADLDTWKTTSENTYDKFRDENWDAIMAQVMALTEKASEICDYMNTCGQEIVDNWRDNQAAPQAAYLQQQITDGQACLAQIQDAIADADATYNQQANLYLEYEAGEAALSPAIMAQAQTLLDSGDIAKECFDHAFDCAKEFKEKYQLNWEVNEHALAGKIMEMACRMANGLEDQYEFKTGLSEDCLAHWADNYADCDAQIGEGIMAEAKLLMDTRKDTFDVFVDMQEKFFDCWETDYKPLERDYAAQVISKGSDRVCALHDQIDDMCIEADEFAQCFKDFMLNPEKTLLPKLMTAGITACEQQIDSYEGLDDLFDKLFDTWCEDIMPCDVKDIQAMCGLYDKKDLGCEVVDNNECATEIAEKAKNCWLDFGLQCEKDYLVELCDMLAYTPEFCKLEDRAVTHVRRQMDIARENILRQGSRFCTGDQTRALAQLERERVRLESQAITVANRFERWWEVQEANRRHQYKFDMISAVSALGALALQGFNQSTAGYDGLLTHIHNRLARSYSYLANANQAGSSAAGSAAQGVAQSINAANTGHWLAEHGLNVKREADAVATQLVLRAQEQTRIGHDYANYAMSAEAQAEATARDGIQDALNAMTHGRQFKQLGLSASVNASSDSATAQELGLRHIDMGHYWVDQGRMHKDQAWGVFTSSIAQSQNAVAQGHATLNNMLAFERHRDSLIQQCRNNGMEASAQQLEIMSVGYRKMETALKSAEAGLANAIRILGMGQQQDSNWMQGFHGLAGLGAPASHAIDNIFGRGHTLMNMSANYAVQGYNQKMEMCEKICQHVRDREMTRMSQLMSFNGLAANTGQLAQMFGGGLANSVEGLLGSIQNMAGQPPSMLQGTPAPGGSQVSTSVNVNPTFGAGFSNVGLLGSGLS